MAWTQFGSDFNLLFEQAAMSLAKKMPVLAAFCQVEVTDKRPPCVST